MQTWLENDTDFKAKIKGDPFAMLEKIKLKICDPSKMKCPCVALFKQLERPLDTNQEDEEPLIKHTKRFKQIQDNVKSIVETEWLEQFVESTAEHMWEMDKSKQKKLEDDSFEMFMACAFLWNGDSDKCGSLKKKFQTQCALNNDQCPKKPMGMSDAFQSHACDQACTEAPKKTMRRIKTKWKQWPRQRKWDITGAATQECYIPLLWRKGTLCCKLSNERQNVTRKLGDQDRNANGVEPE